jgi:hypothetical protein
VAADWQSGRMANQSFNVPATVMDLAAGAPATETGTDQARRRRRGAGAGQRGCTGRGRTRAVAGVGQVWGAGGEVVKCFLRTRLDAVEAQPGQAVARRGEGTASGGALRVARSRDWDIFLT